MSARFAYHPIGAGVHGATEVHRRLLEAYGPALESIGGRSWSLDPFRPELPLACFVSTGGVEGVILDLLAGDLASEAPGPVLLIAHPGHNSLPASLEVLARLRQDGGQGRIFFLDGPEDAAGLAALDAAVKDVEVARALGDARIGLVGGPSDWLAASAPDPSVVRYAWGPTVVPIEMDELTSGLEDAGRDEVRALAKGLRGEASKIVEPGRADVEKAVRVRVALGAIVERHRLDAVAVRCFDLVTGPGTTGCFALSHLTDDGITAGCEGDLVSTVAMLWAKLLLDRLPWMANPARVDATANRLWLAHCTVPRGLVDSYSVRSHFESGTGVAIQGALPPGEVTLLRVGGKHMELLWAAEGRVIRSGDSADMCRTQVAIELDRPGAVAEILDRPLGNHLVVVRGRCEERLRTWRSFFGPDSRGAP